MKVIQIFLIIISLVNFTSWLSAAALPHPLTIFGADGYRDLITKAKAHEAAASADAKRGLDVRELAQAKAALQKIHSSMPRHGENLPLTIFLDANGYSIADVTKKIADFDEEIKKHAPPTPRPPTPTHDKDLDHAKIESFKLHIKNGKTAQEREERFYEARTQIEQMQSIEIDERIKIVSELEKLSKETPAAEEHDKQLQEALFNSTIENFDKALLLTDKEKILLEAEKNFTTLNLISDHQKTTAIEKMKNDIAKLKEMGEPVGPKPPLPPSPVGKLTTAEKGTFIEELTSMKKPLSEYTVLIKSQKERIFDAIDETTEKLTPIESTFLEDEQNRSRVNLIKKLYNKLFSRDLSTEEATNILNEFTTAFRRII